MVICPPRLSEGHFFAYRQYNEHTYVLAAGIVVGDALEREKFEIPHEVRKTVERIFGRCVVWARAGGRLP